MSVRFTKTDITHFFHQYHLGCVLGYRRYRLGFANTVVAVHTSHGQYILKIAERNNPIRVQYEVDLLNFLHNLPTPRPVPTLEGEYLPYFDGTHRALVYRALPGRQVARFTEPMLKSVGRFLGQMHQQSIKFHSSVPRVTLYYFPPKVLRENVRVCRKNLDHSISQRIPYLQERIIRYSLPKAVPQGAMHIDLKPENVLFSGTRLTGVVDFDNSYNGPLILDLANTMMWFCSKTGRFNIQQAKAINRGYGRARQLTRIEKKYLFAALHYAFVSHMLNDMYYLALGKLPSRYIRWGIDNLLKTEYNLPFDEAQFNKLFSIA